MLPGAQLCGVSCLLKNGTVEAKKVPKWVMPRKEKKIKVKKTGAAPIVKVQCDLCGKKIHSNDRSHRDSKKCRSKQKAKISKAKRFAPREIEPVLVRVDLYSLENKEKWQSLRYEVLREQGKKCACCETLKGPFHVDHIKPKSKFPELTFIKANLQVLCEDCNLGKSYKWADDWRSSQIV